LSEPGSFFRHVRFLLVPKLRLGTHVPKLCFANLFGDSLFLDSFGFAQSGAWERETYFTSSR
jgi:hypothetical protein